MRRLRACRADWVAVHRRLAAAGVLAQCHRAGIEAMVWTVDEDAEMTPWLTSIPGDGAEPVTAGRPGCA